MIQKRGEAKQQPLKIDRSYDVPNLAGYSIDGNTMYVDRSLPRSFRSHSGHVIDVALHLAYHEITEKALMDRLGISYADAHALATAAEKAEVEKAGINWNEYQGFMDQQQKLNLHKEHRKLPPDLDKSPES